MARIAFLGLGDMGRPMAARKLGASAVLGEAAAGAFQRSVDKGFGDANESRVIDALR